MVQHSEAPDNAESVRQAVQALLPDEVIPTRHGLSILVYRHTKPAPPRRVDQEQADREWVAGAPVLPEGVTLTGEQAEAFRAWQESLPADWAGSAS